MAESPASIICGRAEARWAMAAHVTNMPATGAVSAATPTKHEVVFPVTSTAADGLATMG
jgi:hypothetical protein